jgi:hypothetical protein
MSADDFVQKQQKQRGRPLEKVICRQYRFSSGRRGCCRWSGARFVQLAPRHGLDADFAFVPSGLCQVVGQAEGASSDRIMAPALPAPSLRSAPRLPATALVWAAGGSRFFSIRL